MAEDHVLVVEDEPSFSDALTLGLGREGFAVTVSSDGADALRRFDEVQPDIVLLDVMLPTLSGIDVCRAIRAKSNVPIIMVSAKSEELDMVVGLEVGADDYVSKPYRGASSFRCPSKSSTCLRFSSRMRDVSCLVSSLSNACGARTTTATPKRSTFTSSDFGPR